MRMRVGSAPAPAPGAGAGAGLLRSPALSTAFAVRMPPPGPYRLRITGKPGAIEIVRVDADDQPMDAGTLRAEPESAEMWWGLGQPP